MKIKTLLLPIMSLLLVGCGEVPLRAEAEILNPTVKEDLKTWLSKFDTNYIRDTEMSLTDEAFNKVSTKNHFPFTQKRRTLWTDNALYMTGLVEQVNSGYYSIKENGVDQLYHYSILGDSPETHINDLTGELITSQIQTGYNYACNDFFINMHKFHDNQAWIDKFSYVNDYFVSTDEEVFSDFMAFTASCYTNPSFPIEEQGETLPVAELTSEQGDSVIIEEPFLSFKEARIYKDATGDKLFFKLYVTDDCKDKIENQAGLFSSAAVYDAGNVTIPILENYLLGK